MKIFHNGGVVDTDAILKLAGAFRFSIGEIEIEEDEIEEKVSMLNDFQRKTLTKLEIQWQYRGKKSEILCVAGDHSFVEGVRDDILEAMQNCREYVVISSKERWEDMYNV